MTFPRWLPWPNPGTLACTSTRVSAGTVDDAAGGGRWVVVVERGSDDDGDDGEGGGGGWRG